MTLATTTRRLAYFLTFSIVVVTLFAEFLRPEWNVNPPPWQGRIFLLDTVDDSWRYMQKALEYLRGPNTEPVYTELQKDRAKFQYPLSSLFFFAPLQDFSEWLGLSNVKKVPEFNRDRFMGLFGVLFVGLTILCAAVLFEHEIRKTHAPPDLHHGTVIRAGLLVLAGLSFYPMIKGFQRGQIQVWLNGLFALSLLAFYLQRRALSGGLIGVMCLIKPQYVLFLVWGLLRREWGFTLAFLIVGSIGGVAALVTYGLAHNLDYFNMLSFLSRHGEGYYPNQSINGILNRIMSIHDPEAYPNLMPGAFPPYTPLVYIGTLASSVLILGVALFRRTEDRMMDFSILGISATIASPVAWEHHYGILFPVFALMLARTKDRSALIWLGISYAICSNYLVALNRFADTPFNFLQSYLFFGTLILLVLIYSESCLPHSTFFRPLA